MASRRLTRASSKASSNRAESPEFAQFILNDSAERDPARNANRSPIMPKNLPAVQSSFSAAYGSGVAVLPQPPRQSLPQQQRFEEALSDLVQPLIAENTADKAMPTPRKTRVRKGAQTVSETPVPGRGRPATRRTQARTSAADTPTPVVNVPSSRPETTRSFGNESGLFGDADLHSSVQHSYRATNFTIPPGPIVEHPEDESDLASEQNLRLSQKDAGKKTGLKNAKTKSNPPPTYNFVDDDDDNEVAGGRLPDIWSKLSTRALSAFAIAGPLVFLLAISTFLLPHELFDPRFYGSDFVHNVGQLVPYSLAHPIQALNEDQYATIDRRLATVENDVAFLKQSKNLHQKSIDKLFDLLPDSIVLQKDAHGEPQVPEKFWRALQKKLDIQNFAATDSPPSGTGKASNPTYWDRFLKTNEARKKHMNSQESEWAGLLDYAVDNDILLSKKSFVELLNKNYHESLNVIRQEIDGLSDDVEKKLRDAQSQESNIITSKSFSRQLKNAVDQFFSEVQLEALVRAKLGSKADFGTRRVNFFSTGAGAVIIPQLTSPTFVFASQRAFGLKKAFVEMIRQRTVPHPPSVALSRWEEQGDCWCTPARTGHFAPQIGVIMPYRIFPDQVVIEHIPAVATLDPKSTPRHFEVFTHIEDQDKRTMLDDYLRRYHLLPLPPSTDDERDELLTDGWYRIASFEYDINGEMVQAFDIDAPLKKFQIASEKLVVRSQSNNGADHTCFYRIRVHGEMAETQNDLS